MLEIDGSHGEGGGQMLRTALALSVLTQTPFRMVKIRAGREKPGLKAQHLHALKCLKLLGPVRFEGAFEGSSEIAFTPAPIRGCEGSVDIGTAGSVTLLLQTLLPAAAQAEGPSRIEIVGGTDVAWSPPIDYVRNVTLDERGQLHLRRRGFFPRGGGRVVLETPGGQPPAPLYRTTRGDLKEVLVFSAASKGLEERAVADRQAEAAGKRLRRHGVPVRIEATYDPSSSIGSVVTCVAVFEDGSRLGADALGAPEKRSEDVGREAADALSAEIHSGAPVDEHAADQWILRLALAGGEIRTGRITGHTRTNVWVVERFLGPVLEIDDTTVRCVRPRNPF